MLVPLKKVPTSVRICISAVWYRLPPLGCDSKFINSSLALFLMAKKKFQIFRGWGAGLFFVPLENRAWAVSRSTTPRADTTVPRTIGEITAPGGTAQPRRGRAVRNPAVSPCSSAVTSSRVNGQTGDWLRSPLASTPLRVWGGSGRGRGRGYTEKGEDSTPRGGGWKSETLPAWRGRRFGHSTPD